MPQRFESRKVYRRTDLHDQFGGQWQSGIVTPRKVPVILIFTGDSGERHGYVDEVTEDGVFIYTGEGQVGDMTFVRGNLAIRDHAANGKELHVFDVLAKPKGFVRYRGQFTADSWHEEQLSDRNGDTRKGIRFHLIPLEDAGSALLAPLEDTAGATGEAEQVEPATATLPELRLRALAAAEGTAVRKPSEARRSYFARSRAVAAYVLARADGNCECCKQPAPFRRPNGEPYLEPHHTRRLADGGPDHPSWVAAICPTCHRLIHYGAKGDEQNARLEAYLERLEGNED